MISQHQCKMQSPETDQEQDASDQEQGTSDQVRYPQNPRHRAVTYLWPDWRAALSQASADAQLRAEILERCIIGGGTKAKTKSADLAAALGLDKYRDGSRLKRVVTSLGAMQKESGGPIKFRGGTQAVGYYNIALKPSADGEAPGIASALFICVSW